MRRVYPILLTLSVLAAPAWGAKQDIDFDFILQAADDALLELVGPQFGRLYNQDRDGNGILDHDQLAMLSAVLLGNNPQIPASLQNQIQAGFEANKDKVARDLILDINVAGVFNQTVNVLELLADEDPLFPYAVQNMLAGIMTAGDNSTIGFLNNFLKDMVVFVAEREGYGFALDLIDLNDYINFSAGEYNNYGDGGLLGNYLGRNGNIDGHLNGTSNFQEYAASSGTFKREQWLERCNLVPPLRILADPAGGSAETGDPFTFTVVAVGGQGAKHFQWLRTDSNGKEFPTAYDLVGPDSESYTIAYVSVLDRARFSVAVSDDVSVYNPGTRTGGRQSWGARLTVTQVPFQIVAEPQSATLNIGDPYALAFRVRGGSAAPSYFWSRNGVPAGPNAPVFDLSPVSGASGGNYQCVALSGAESLSSVVAEITVIGAGNEVSIPDPALRGLLEEALGFASGGAIFEGDMLRLTGLSGNGRGIVDLSGLDKAFNLTWLELYDNGIADLRPLAVLEKLEHLNVALNFVADLGPLANLRELASLYAWNNEIAALGPLVDNPGIGEGDEISVEANPLGETARCAEAEDLRGRGVLLLLDGTCDLLAEGEAEGEEPEGEFLPEGEGDAEAETEGGTEGEAEGEAPLVCGAPQGELPCGATFTSTDVPVALPSLGEAVSALCVEQTGTVTDVQVSVSLAHPATQTLALLLVAPSGYQTFLMSKPQVPGENLLATTFNDEASCSVQNAEPPFTGQFVPVTPLRSFDGEALAGKWQLRVIDIASGGEGTLNAWSLGFNPCAPEPVPPPCPGDLPDEGEDEGETPIEFSSADLDRDSILSLSELLRVIQLFNAIRIHCDGASEDGFAPGPGSYRCRPHTSDYNPQDWRITLNELLRLVQLYNSPGNEYHADPSTEDGLAPGPG